ncbi:hypothetical protein [Legionella sp. W05-934-2]|jgi:hypothetical protein|uniref:hypothetical protein n=1 Tax=Legionella sp. W05-934-2 TaxID=1198649 RepID=UPI003461E909
MRWIAIVPLALLLSACGTLYTSEVVSYRTVTVDPSPPTFVIVDEAPVDVTMTEIDYY